MTGNWDIQAAIRYHEGTRHPGGRLMDPWHRFYPSQQPLLFKRYPDLEPIPLTLNPSPAGMSALEAISISQTPGDTNQTPDLATLSRLLYFSAGITKRIDYPGYGTTYFRAAACTGALYHIELYVVCGALKGLYTEAPSAGDAAGGSPTDAGLAAGVYHFDPADFSLRQLREGDYRHVLVDASGNAEEISHAPLMLVYTDVFYRNAVKYQARAYRHAFWDSGTIISHSLAVAAAHHLPASLVMGFIDDAVNALLGLDPTREAALAILGVGSGSQSLPSEPDMPPLSYRTMPVLERERVFPAIAEIHTASSLDEPQQVVDWRKWAGAVEGQPLPAQDTIALQPLSSKDRPANALEQVILRRGSTRRYAHEPLSFGQLSTLLECSTRGFTADFLRPGTSLLHTYLIAHAVDGMEPGVYRYFPGAGMLERLKQGNFRLQSRHLALDQELAGDASINLYFLTDLKAVLERFGNRGYRAAQMEGSLTAGRVYLAAYAQHLGATGLTFYDDAVTEFLSPQANDLSVMFLMTVGKKARPESRS